MYSAVTRVYISIIFVIVLLYFSTSAHKACATPYTTTYQFRLVDGVTLLDGRLELKPLPSEPWGTVCSNVFKENKYGPNAACRSLGFYNTTDSYFVSFGRGNASSPIWLDEVTCSLGTTYFQNCTSKDLGDHNCGHGDDSGVRCVAPGSYWEFKFANSSVASRGLVLFRPYPFLPWGTIHMPAYASRYAATTIIMRRAICRSLGITVSYPITAPAQTYGAAHSSAPTYIRSIEHSCGGNGSTPTKTLTKDCALMGYMSQYTWDETEQLSMYCDELELMDTVEVRLIGGPSSSCGQIQYRPNSQSPWMYVAFQALLTGSTNNMNNSAMYNNAGLNAVCRSAGFTDVIQAGFRFFGVWPQGGVQPPAQLASIVCGPNAQTMLDCALNRTYENSRHIPAGIDCYPERSNATLSQWEFRLHNTTTAKPSKGIAQMRFGPTGPWGSITTNETNNYGLWDAFCNKVGYPSGSTRITRNLAPFTGNSKTWMNGNSADIPSAFLSRVSCPVQAANLGSMSSYTHASVDLLNDCKYEVLPSSLSIGAMALALDCDSTPTITDSSQWQVRITNGNGLVEFRPSSTTTYGYICTNDNAALVVLCAVAGYDSDYVEWVDKRTSIAAAPDAYDASPFYMPGLKCTPGSKTFAGCTFDHFEGETCAKVTTAGVNCYATINDPRLWTFRLVGGSDASTGRLDVKLAPWLEWGTICKDSWTITNTRAACRSLGFETDDRIMAPRLLASSLFPPSGAAILLDDMNCGSIRYLQNCTRYTFLLHNCNHGQDVSLQCWPPEPPPSSGGGGGGGGGGGTIAYYPLEFRGVLVDSEDNPSFVRVEARFAGATDWGSIYMSSYPLKLLQVACSTVGFPNSVAPERLNPAAVATYRNLSSRVLLGGYTCGATATHLDNCTYDRDMYMLPTNDHTSDMVIDCTNVYALPAMWQFRLVDGTKPSNGRIEMLPMPWATWGTICSDSFTNFAANAIAACTSAGFDHNKRVREAGPDAIIKVPSMATFKVGTGTIWINSVGCSSVSTFNPLYLSNCTYAWRPTTCTHTKDVGLECEHPIYSTRNFEYRFVPIDPSIPGVGRVEMRPSANDTWGTIYQNVRTNIAIVSAACRSVGFTDPKPAWATITAGTGPVYVHDFICPTTGDNTTLHDCTVTPATFMSSTNHGRDLVIECDYVSPTDKTYWEFKLVDGESVKPHYGRVMFRPAPWTVWGTFNAQTFDPAVSASICRSLGYTTENGYRDPDSAQFTMNLAPKLTAGRVWVYNTLCTLRPFTYFQNCSSYAWRPSVNNHAYDAWLDCYPNIEVKLVDGPAPWNGRIMVKYNNWTNQATAWGTMCNDNFINNHYAWLAVCRTAGYTNVTLAKYKDYGEGTGPISMDDVDCNEDQLNLNDCTYRQIGTHNCYHSEDSGVNCYADPDDHSIWQFRFYGTGSTSTKGRIELLPGTGEDTWGSICPNIWNHTKHSWLIACKTLGVVTTRAVPTSFGAGFGPLHTDSVDCNATNTDLRQCDAFPLGSYDCTPSEAFGLDCDPPPEDVSTWEFKLDNTTINARNKVGLVGTTIIDKLEVVTAGTVMVRFSSKEKWGTICSNNKQLQSMPPSLVARLICQSVGLYTPFFHPKLYTTNASVIKAPDWYPIVLSNVSCSPLTKAGGVSSLRHCAHNDMYDHSCTHAQDLHVDCYHRERGTLTDTVSKTTSTSNTVSTTKKPSASVTLTTSFSQTIPIMPTVTDTITLSSLRPRTRTRYYGDVYHTPTSTPAGTATPVGSASIEISKSLSHTGATQHEKTQSAPHNPTASANRPPTLSFNTSSTVARTPTAHRKRTTSPTPSLQHTQSHEASQSVRPRRTATMVPPTTTPEPRIDYNIRVPCEYNLAIAFNGSITDADLRSHNTILTISLPTRASATSVGLLPFYFRDPRKKNATVWGPLSLVEPNMTAEAADTGMPPAPFAIPNPLVRIYDQNVGTNEPLGYTAVYGEEGQNPMKRYGGGWWAALGLGESSNNYNASGGGVDAHYVSSDPLNDALLASKFDGRVYCEVISAKTVRCVIPRSSDYTLYAEDKLVLELLPAMLEDWVMPKCFTDASGSLFAYIDGSRNFTLPMTADDSTTRYPTTTTSNRETVPFTTGDPDDTTAAAYTATTAVSTSTSSSSLETKTSADATPDTTTVALGTTPPPTTSTPADMALTSATQSLYVPIEEARRIMHAMGNDGLYVAKVVYEGILPGHTVRYIPSTAGAIKVGLVVNANAPSQLGAAIDAFGPVAGIVSVLAAILGGSSAMDVQIVAMLGQSACMAEVDRRATNILRYFITPLFDLGYAAMAYGNLAVAIVFSTLQLLLARHFQASRRIREIDSWAATRFPSYSYACVQLMYVGACYGSVSMVSGNPAATGGDVDTAAAFVLGAIGCITCIATIALIGYVALEVVRGKFIQYTQFLSRAWYRRWLYPLGFWEMPAQRLAYGYMLNPYRQGNRLKLFSAAGFVTSFATSAIMLISPIPCEVRLGLVGVLFLLVALMYAVLRPARLPSNSAFSFAGQIMMALLVFISAAQIIVPTVAVVNAKLIILLLQILLVIVRSVFSIVVSILEDVRWSKFRNQNDGFADDSDLLDQRHMGLTDIDDFDSLFGDGSGEDQEVMVPVKKRRMLQKRPGEEEMDGRQSIPVHESSDDIAADVDSILSLDDGGASSIDVLVSSDEASVLRTSASPSAKKPAMNMRAAVHATNAGMSDSSLSLSSGASHSPATLGMENIGGSSSKDAFSSSDGASASAVDPCTSGDSMGSDSDDLL